MAAKRRRKTYRGFRDWKLKANRITFLRWLEACLGFKRPEHWYEISVKRFRDMGGGGLLANHYRDSPAFAAMELYPDYDWKEWLFTRVPAGLWDDSRFQKRYLGWLGNELGIKSTGDWYDVTGEDFLRHSGRSLLRRYNDSPCLLFSTLMPSKDWVPWKFRQTPKRFWSERENRKRYFFWLGEKLGFESPEDWYQISGRDFEDNFGSGFLAWYGTSPIAAVKEHFENHSFNDWMFASCLKGFWRRRANRKTYLEWLGKELGYRTWSDWYRVTSSDFERNFGATLLARHGSVSRLVKDHIEGGPWLEWLFQKTPANFFKFRKNRIRYLDWLGGRLNFGAMEDWYGITQGSFTENSGVALLAYYRYSPVSVLKDLLPNVDWLEWRFGVVPNGFWKPIRNRRRYLYWLGTELGFKTPKDWCSISEKDFETTGGGAMLQMFYKGSPSAAVMALLPELSLYSWQFDNVSKGYWASSERRRDCLLLFGKHNGFKNDDDWYQIDRDELVSFAGHGLLKYHRGSAIAAVMELFPEKNLLEWRFRKAPGGFWKEKSNRIRYLRWLSKQLRIRTPEGWYGVTKYDLAEHYGSALLANVPGGSLAGALAELHPRFQWDDSKFWDRLDTQKLVYRFAKEFFVGLEVKWNYKHPGLRFEETNFVMELDIFVPARNFGIEYQGEHHSQPLKFFGGKRGLAKRKKRDKQKRSACQKAGIILLEVPHTWDREKTSLFRMIRTRLNTLNK